MNNIRILLVGLLLILGQVFSLGNISNGGLLAQKPNKKSKKGKNSVSKAEIDPKTREKIDYLYIEACTQHLEEKRTEAIALFKEVASLEPANHGALYNIGVIYNELHEYDEAMRYGKMALDGNPENYWYYVALIEACQGARDLPKALSYQTALAEKFPQDKNALYDLAQLNISNKDFARALETYTRLEKLTGQNEEIQFRKHQLYVYTEQPEKGLAELNKLIDANPAEPRYYQAKYDLLMLMNREQEAQVVLEQLLAINPNDGFAMISLADFYRSKGDHEQSDAYLQRAFENPDVDLEIKVKILGGMYATAESDSKVLPRLEKMSATLVNLHPKSALVLGIRGDVFLAAEKNDSATAYYRKSLLIDPTNQEVWQELLLIDLDNHDKKQLQKDAEKALEYFPNQNFFLYAFGYGSMQVGDDEEAVYAFEKVKKSGEANPEITLQAYLSLGEIFHEQKQYGKSDENFEAAMKFSPNNPLVLNNYAYYLSLRNERLDDASKMVKEALQKEPENGAYQDTYGWILYLQGKYQEAEQWIQKAVNKGGGAEVLEHFGDTEASLGKMQEAEKYWQRAIDNGATFDLETKKRNFSK